MDFIGEILVGPDSSGFTRQQWIDLIREHPNLVNPQPREGINPFTKERIIFPLRLDVAHVVVDGKTVGTMSWAEDDSMLINVYGESEAVVPVAHAVAKSLGGRFEAVSQSRSCP
jgi:hypothetical protein